MSEPNWVPLGVRGGIIDYVGGWSAATPYKPGDVVVYNGIPYLAVNPSTNQAPPPAASGGIPAALLDAKGDLIVASAPDAPARLGVGTDGQVLIADAASAAGVKWASGELAYAQVTANTSVTVTTEATAITVVTAPSVTFDGVTPVMVEFFAPLVHAGATGIALYLTLFDGSTPLGQMGVVYQNASGFHQGPVRVARRLTPTAGAHVFSIRGHLNAAGTGIVSAGAGGSALPFPAFIRVARA